MPQLGVRVPLLAARRVWRICGLFLLRGLFARALAPVPCGLFLALAGVCVSLFPLLRSPRLPQRLLMRSLLGRNFGS